MSPEQTTSHNRLAKYVVLALILVLCLWIGWSDLDIQMSQNELRESIRSTIRRVIQFSIQFAIPAAILAFFAREALGWFRSRAGQQGPDSR